MMSMPRTDTAVKLLGTAAKPNTSWQLPMAHLRVVWPQHLWEDEHGIIVQVVPAVHAHVAQATRGSVPGTITTNDDAHIRGWGPCLGNGCDVNVKGTVVFADCTPHCNDINALLAAGWEASTRRVGQAGLVRRW
jgi:hypothetical protein